MHKSEIYILVVEDDPTLGRAIELGLKRSGYSVNLTTNYEHARNLIKLNDYMGLVVDCMLPQKNGIDTAVDLKKELEHDPVIVLISGIFKDRAYAVDAQFRTKAKAFLNKPFDLQELINIFDESLAHLTEDAHEPLYQLLAREQYSYRDKINAINSTEYIGGYDLPLVYSLLLDDKISGQLSIQYDDAPEAFIGFAHGKIDSVQLQDKDSYFGVLLVEKGFTTPEEVQAGLHQSGGKLLGEKLVDNSSLSPHAVEIVTYEQMVIRLSKTLRDASVKIQFKEQERKSPDVFIDGMTLSRLLNDWIFSKIPSEWLQSFHTPWMNSPVTPGAEASKLTLLRGQAALKEFAEYLNHNEWPLTLEELLSKNPKNETEMLRGVYFALLQRIIVFGVKSNSGVTDNYDVKTVRLEKILKGIENKNHFEVLGLSKKARPSEIERSFKELAKNFHPDKLSQTAPVKLRSLTEKIFSRITEAHQIVGNEQRREGYLKVLEMGDAEEALKAEASFEEALRLLRENRFRDARKAFERTLHMKGHRSDTIVYMIWALIKEKRKNTEKDQLADRVRDLLEQVAHEDRHSPQYFFIKGMYLELTGQIQKAYELLKHCLIIDPHFKDARREMAFIKQNYAKQKTNIFTDDLSTIVGNFFKKKSS